jgi:hypothetical protein
MKRYGLLIVLLYIMIQGCYIQKKEVTKTNLKDVHYLSIEFYPAFDNACYLTIDTSKKIAFLIILSDEYKEVFKGKVSYIDLMNNCNFQSLLLTSCIKHWGLSGYIGEVKFCPASAFATADRDASRNPQHFIHVSVMGNLKKTDTTNI